MAIKLQRQSSDSSHRAAASVACTIDAPALIRVLEYARETLSKVEGSTGDVALHVLAASLLDHNGPISIYDYDDIISVTEDYIRSRSQNRGFFRDSNTRPNEGKRRFVGEAPTRRSILLRARQYPVDLIGTLKAELLDDYIQSTREFNGFQEWRDSVRDKALDIIRDIAPEFEGSVDTILRQVYTSIHQLLRDKKLRKFTRMINNGSVRDLFDTILDVFSRGTPGYGWYRRTAEKLRQYFPDDKEREIVVALLAATSPRVSMSENIDKFIRAYESYLLGNEYVDRLPSVETAVKRIFRDGLGALNGPKTKNFARALLGDPNAVVIDTWLARLLSPLVFNGRRIETLSAAQYTVLEYVVRKFARYLNTNPVDVTGKDILENSEIVQKISEGLLHPTEAQEILWTGVRATTPRGIGKEEREIGPDKYYSGLLKRRILERYEDKGVPDEKKKVWGPVLERINTASRKASTHTARQWIRGNREPSRVR